MGVAVLLEMHIKPECVEEVKAFMKDNLNDTRTYEGCQGLDVFDNMDETGNLVIYERWDSRPHYEKYFAWRTGSGALDRMAPMLKEPLNIRYFERVDV